MTLLQGLRSSHDNSTFYCDKSGHMSVIGIYTGVKLYYLSKVKKKSYTVIHI